MNQKFSVAGRNLNIPNSSAEIAEGKRLFISRGCTDCHGKDLAGVTFINDPAIGTFSGSNLTSGEGGISSSLEAKDFERAIRHGVGSDGRALLFMPATDFHLMTDEDLGRIIAFIKSSPPVDKKSVPIVVGPLGRFLYSIGKMPHLITAELINHDEKLPSKLTPEVSVAYGKYIATTCTGCHGEKLLGGSIPGAPPEWPLAQNITSQGIGKWSESEFIAAMRTGKRPNGTEMLPPMPWQNFSYMTDTELKSLRLYLISI
ncbi:cytochrome c [Leptospira ognonensis]|uniref:Cytochrome c n=2 Tax=Leptospira ognonensis TaxID=2484945 RepID=A0A4R9K3B7_9LEPT|nr:cytochrome c [Leptospira ognonensis]